MPKKTLTAKVSPKNMDRLEEHAEREGISKSEATDRLVKLGLDIEESDMRVVPVKADGGTVIEDRLDEIERNQQSRLNEIESHQERIESKLDQPWYIDLVDKTVLWSWAFTVTGIVAWALSTTGYLSISGDLATVLTLVSGVIFVVSRTLLEAVE